jgi:pyruvate/2-oxoglutarate dehydrogenase complex dihydrolipoamide acyltransferase (E2) component
MTTEYITPNPESASVVLDSPECRDVARFPTHATITGCEKNDHVVAFPRLQRQAIDWMELNHRRHTMHGLIEVDVTDARRAIKQYRARTGAPLSLTAFMISCFARAVAQHTAMQAYCLGSGRLVLFADVDVGTMVEREIEGAKLPVPLIIRAAQAKSLDQISQEIRAAQNMDPEAILLASLPLSLQPPFRRGLSVWLALPAALRRLIWTWALQNPYRRKRLTGTVGVTAVGMFGRGTGWGVAPMAHTLTLVVGGLDSKPGVVGTRIEPREYLCLTLTMDHDVIDGAPATRFTNRFKQLVETGAGLHDETAKASV